MQNKKYDLIIIGSGSIGTPTAYFCAKNRLKTLVIEKNKAPGRGQNRAAIGGIRATHSDYAKAMLCLRSIEIFKNWFMNTGDDINWFEGGYFYPIYKEEDKVSVLSQLKFQKSIGLNINFISKEEALEIAPDLVKDGLLGALYSPEDGSASPLKSNYSFYKNALLSGAEFNFEEEALELITKGDKVIGVKTSKDIYYSNFVILSTGKDANNFKDILNVDIPIKPDCHEAGITEPIARLFNPMIVDMRVYDDSKNIYFYQNKEGQIVFCLTPNPSIYGDGELSTSNFLLQFSKRLFDVYPILGNLRIRRIWRGFYPNTPDGNPIIELLDNNVLLLAGMCGQGFMLGPSIGELAYKIISNSTSSQDKKVISSLPLHRTFDNAEFFK
ncbi:MAG TPA: FAD-binding oxidoreductase [Exilispira sp.]|nr:FAD-binding oxidoreductase [Exilispira sp.]